MFIGFCIWAGIVAAWMRGKGLCAGAGVAPEDQSLGFGCWRVEVEGLRVEFESWRVELEGLRVEVEGLRVEFESWRVELEGLGVRLERVVLASGRPFSCWWRVS
ncbi:hypothetical protein [Ralstonia sp. Ralssp110]|uniref:hypothetical protein n=1 Tax=Ralstonia sp. Ralssp110 TaxID=3243004 RepID=UPI0039B5B7C6